MSTAPLTAWLTECSDAELVAHCRGGEEAAWRVLVARYQRLVFTVPRRAGLAEADAAEVFQATFTALFEQLDGLQQADRLHAWLVTTARRQTLQQLDRLRRHAAVPLGAPLLSEDGSVIDDPHEPADPDALAPPERLEELQAHDRVRRALDSLDRRSRELLSYLYLSDPPLTYEEVADRMGMALGSVGPTRNRCMEKLRRALEALP
jgi:RNA polymerase sigma factor (sigma-70 family)